MKHRTASNCLAFFIVGCLSPNPIVSFAQTPQKPIRVAVDVVPVDVIVLDSDGNPVTDLRPEDFQIWEDGIPRTIVNYAFERVGDIEPSAGRGRAVEGIAQRQIERTFLIFLGRGRHAEYFETLDNLVAFLENGLGPSDSVAVMAYGRATGFTRDRASVVSLLERYRANNPAIELALEQRSRTLASIYGRPGFVPEKTLQRIETIFAGQLARTLPARQIRSPDDQVYASRSSEELIRLKGTEPGPVVEGPNPRATVSGPGIEKTLKFDQLRLTRITDLSFDDYLEARASTHNDLQSLLAAIDYLRYREGEKHLLFFTGYGLFLPNLEKDEGLAAYASDARVRIHTIQTGGMDIRGGYSRSFALTSLRNLSDLSGGTASIHRWVHEALDQVSRVTGTVYRLAYRQDRFPMDGRYRKIRVTVRRKDVRVLARGGYYAGPLDVELIDRKKLLTYSRTAAAAGSPEAISDIRFRLKIDADRTRDGQRPCTVQVRIRADGTLLQPAEGAYRGELTFLILVANEDGEFVGQHSETYEMQFDETAYRRALDHGILIRKQTLLPVIKGSVKVILYDPINDLLGVQTRRIY